jgi:endonuclease/exonuclease/phosphatase family metal-dependent hydrolase
VLRDWITKQRQTGLPVIIAGDFNRQFRRLEGQYALWRAINGVNQDVEVTEPWFVGHPLSATRKCPTRKGSSLEPIDWILVDLSLAEQVVTGSFWETRWSQADVDASQNGRGLSDHCPISLDLELGG